MSMYSYYSITVLIGLFAIGYIHAEKEIVHLPPHVLQAAVDCIAETGIDPQVLTQFSRSNVFGSDHKSPEAQKFVYCTFKRMGYARKNGHIKIDRALDIFPKTTDRQPLKKVMEECNEENGSDAPETTYKIFSCFVKKSPVKIVL